MSDSDRCRATAARYAWLANATRDVDDRIGYLELERLWLETASWTDRLHLEEDESARGRIYALIDASGSHLTAGATSLH